MTELPSEDAHFVVRKVPPRLTIDEGSDEIDEGKTDLDYRQANARR